MDLFSKVERGVEHSDIFIGCVSAGTLDGVIMIEKTSRAFVLLSVMFSSNEL